MSKSNSNVLKKIHKEIEGFLKTIKSGTEGTLIKKEHKVKLKFSDIKDLYNWTIEKLENTSGLSECSKELSNNFDNNSGPGFKISIKCGEKTFSRSIVITIASTAHTQLDLSSVSALMKAGIGKFTTAIRVND